jgi:hypothetical protein
MLSKIGLHFQDAVTCMAELGLAHHYDVKQLTVCQVV